MRSPFNAAFGPQISADQRNNVRANQRFLLRAKVAQGKLHRYHILTILVLILPGLASMHSPAQVPKNNKSDSEWPPYGRDGGGERYSPLNQINRENVRNLKVAWSYRTGGSNLMGRSI
jgi:quinoprotein glucose dehydrogenase